MRGGCEGVVVVCAVGGKDYGFHNVPFIIHQRMY